MTDVMRLAPVRAVLAVALAAGPGTPAYGSGAPAESGLCLKAAAVAARETGVPLRVLAALTLTETGRSRAGTLQAWPWALNEGGEGRWFEDRAAALEHLASAISAGTTNIDVGCFQLNYRWHGAAFASLEKMMDPEANARYAARLVAQLASASGDWVAAAGAYHSQTPDVAQRYLARFEPIYLALDGASPGPSRPERQATRENGFPLLVRGASGAAGSIVPLKIAARPLFEAP